MKENPTGDSSPTIKALDTPHNGDLPQIGKSGPIPVFNAHPTHPSSEIEVAENAGNIKEIPHTHYPILGEKIGGNYVLIIKALRGTYGLSKEAIAELHGVSVKDIDSGLHHAGTSFKELVQEIRREQGEGKHSDREQDRIDMIPLYDDSVLPQQERELLQKRYFPKGRVPTLEELGAEMGVSRERARQLLNRAVAKLVGQAPDRPKQKVKRNHNTAISQAKKQIQKMNRLASSNDVILPIEPEDE